MTDNDTSPGSFPGRASTPEELARRAIESPGAMLSMLSIINGPYLSAARHREGLHVLIDGKYPHYFVLQRYFAAAQLDNGALQRTYWAKPLRELIKLGPEVAPVDHRDAETSGVFTFGDWRPASELTRELAELYVSAGFIKWDKPLHGNLPKPGRQNGDEGFLPLAAAIYHRHDQAVQLLLDKGASLNVGPLTDGGPDVDAVDFATRVSSPEVISLLTAHRMRKQISTSPSSQPASLDPNGSASEVPARRRRMGV